VGVMEASQVHGVTFDPAANPADRIALRNGRILAAATDRYRRARAAEVAALVAMIEAHEEYVAAQNQLVQAHRTAREPNHEITLGRAWLSSLEIEGVDFRKLAHRAQEAGCLPQGMLRP
jgi:hypothetical protein